VNISVFVPLVSRSLDIFIVSPFKTPVTERTKRRTGLNDTLPFSYEKKVTEHRVPELIPVLGSQPAGDVSHKPGGRLPLLSATPTVTLNHP